MNRHLKEFLIDFLHLSIPVVCISLAVVAMHRRENKMKDPKVSREALQEDGVKNQISRVR